MDLNDSWTITPTLMHQQQESNGAFAYDPSLGDLKVARYRPEHADDRWTQAALTVEGKIANLDVVYAGSYLKRNVDTQQDYSDYSLFYDISYGYTVYNDDGDTIEPTQYIQGKDRYKRQSHEFRLSTPADKRVRFVGGLFYQRQQHGIEQRYKIDNLTPVYEVSDWPDTIWLTEQRAHRSRLRGVRRAQLRHHREADGDRRRALVQSRELAGRLLRLRRGLQQQRQQRRGTLCMQLGQRCAGDRTGWVPYTSVSTAPCTNLDKSVKDDGVTPKVNLTYKFDDDRMVYVTYSEGFRPGGVNRRGTFPPYDADYLKNYEVGWKTTWMDNRLRFNGAVFMLDWDDFQFSFTGENGLTNITNAGGARIKGLEADVEFAATESFLISGGLSVLDAKLRGDFCELLDASRVSRCR